MTYLRQDSGCAIILPRMNCAPAGIRVDGSGVKAVLGCVLTPVGCYSAPPTRIPSQSAALKRLFHFMRTVARDKARALTERTCFFFPFLFDFLSCAFNGYKRQLSFFLIGGKGGTCLFPSLSFSDCLLSTRP